MKETPKHITGTNGLILNPGNVPVVRSGSWHTLPPYGSAGSSNVPVNRTFALPFWPGRRCVVTGVAVNVTLAVAGGNIRMGLYSSANGHPLKLIQDYGTVAVGVLGVRSITGMTNHVVPRLYFLTVTRQGGLLNLGLSSRDTWDPLVSETSPALTANLSAYYTDGVSGPLPQLFGTPAGTVQGPGISVQLT